MLASIHPLGERGRGNRFWVTATAYLGGSLVGGAIAGALLGAVGSLFVDFPVGARSVLFAAAAALALLLDARGVRPRSWHRQVNEDWLAEYRGWVYGFGFGLQLGTGFVTIVTTASIYLAWLGAFVLGSAELGALVGLGFGLARALPLIAGSRVHTPHAVRARYLRWARREGWSLGAVVAVEACAIVLVLLAVAG